MQKNTSTSGYTITRNLIAVLFCIAGVSLATFTLAAKPSTKKASPTASTSTTTTVTPKRTFRGGTGTTPSAPSPGTAALSTSNRSLTYTESGAQVPNETGVALGSPDCTVPNSCSTFNLTIDPSVGISSGGYNPTQFQIHMIWSWSVATVDYDIFFEDAVGNVVAVNNSTADPSAIVLPTTTPAGLYHIVVVLSTGAPIGYTGTVVLEAKPVQTGICGPPADCTPPRYINYPAGPGQADDGGEPSVG